MWSLRRTGCNFIFDSLTISSAPQFVASFHCQDCDLLVSQRKKKKVKREGGLTCSPCSITGEFCGPPHVPPWYSMWSFRRTGCNFIFDSLTISSAPQFVASFHCQDCDLLVSQRKKKKVKREGGLTCIY